MRACVYISIPYTFAAYTHTAYQCMCARQTVATAQCDEHTHTLTCIGYSYSFVFAFVFVLFRGNFISVVVFFSSSLFYGSMITHFCIALFRSLESIESKREEEKCKYVCARHLESRQLCCDVSFRPLLVLILQGIAFSFDFGIRFPFFSPPTACYCCCCCCCLSVQIVFLDF